MPSQDIKSYYTSTPSPSYFINVGDPFDFQEPLFPFEDYPDLDLLDKTRDYQNDGTLNTFDKSSPSISPSQSLSDMTGSMPSLAAGEDWLSSLDPQMLFTDPQTREKSKRTRNNTNGDSINACWTSPLCPNKKDGVTRPDSCRGECADLLFALPSETQFIQKDMIPSDAKINISTYLTEKKEKSPKRMSSRKQEDTKPSQPIQTIPSQPKTDKNKHRVPHSQVEKKYRENVNTQLEILRQAVPSSRNDTSQMSTYDIEDLGVNARQPSKATILSNATAYIKELERENERIKEDMVNLKEQNRTLQLVLNGNSVSLLNSIERWKIENES